MCVDMEYEICDMEFAINSQYSLLLYVEFRLEVLKLEIVLHLSVCIMKGKCSFLLYIR